MQRDMIFDITRSSFVDGPGIRTTVFFKGCNLRCAWCHNPESQVRERQMLFYSHKCKGCGRCRAVCPHALSSCELCGACAAACPEEARKMCGREMTAEEILREVIRDKTFYDASGGGVTFSGGECMLRPAFLRECLSLCREAEIQTAVDTAGCVPWESFEGVLDKTDLFLYDLKLMDKTLHKKYIGADNTLILENLVKLASLGCEIIVRIPVIGGVNDNDSEMHAMAEFLAPLSVRAVELLPYHAMGEHKYTALGVEPVCFAVPAPEKIREWSSWF